MKRTIVVALALVATSARADDAPKWTVAQSFWFGTGNGRPYVKQMALVDMTVSLSIATIELASWAPALRSEGSVTSPFVPPMVLAPLAPLAAPITHFAHGRIVPGVLSLLGWALVDGVVTLATFASSLGGPGDGCVHVGCPIPDTSREVVRANLLTSFAGETLMLVLDTLMASGSPLKTTAR